MGINLGSKKSTCDDTVSREEHKKRKNVTLFNMINCEIAKIDGINKQADECEHCSAFLMLTYG
jgi:hypothetical protein